MGPNYEILDFKLGLIDVHHSSYVLVKIAYEEKINKMSAQNLSVCFGPVFMWSPEESLAAIHDVKFQCSVVELLIEKCDDFFQTSSETKMLNQTLREKPHGITKRTTSR